jgi:predicted nucleic acid-binding protein
MSLSDDLAQIDTVFIDTSPIIYYIEAHPQFGPLAREIVNAFQSGEIVAFSSVITLTEVLPKPIEIKDERLARKFTEFLRYGKNLSLVEISTDIAERAGRLRGRYPDIKALDAIQISASIEVGADAFVTNDQKLKQITEIKVLVLKDYL